MKRNALILGAAGRDFHNFNTYLKNNTQYRVVGFTATQIPGIDDKVYPGKLAGKHYKKGIPVFAEKDLPKIIKKFNVLECFFSYSDVSHEYAMHLASLCQANGATFTLLGPEDTMIKSKRKVIAVTAVRTGCGKSQTSRKIVELLSAKKKKVAAVRHPMPYGNLIKQEWQRFDSFQSLIDADVTIEEREEYEPFVRENFVIFAGVNYERILREAEKEANIILWDGGNNDFPFYKPDLLITVLDPLRAGHELHYYPGETNFRMADVLIINKENSATKEEIQTVVNNIKQFNPRALVIHANSQLLPDKKVSLKDKRVLVVEDGPTTTHGGMNLGAGYMYAFNQKANIVSPVKYAHGEMAATYKKYPKTTNVIPAMGYSEKQIRDLEKTINSIPCDYVVSGTPIELSNLIHINKPLINVRYNLQEKGSLTLAKLLKQKGFL